jgi:hypothetical protein
VFGKTFRVRLRMNMSYTMASSEIHVRVIIAASRLKATRGGRDRLIQPKALAAVPDRKPGDPTTPRTRSSKR